VRVSPGTADHDCHTEETKRVCSARRRRCRLRPASIVYPATEGDMAQYTLMLREDGKVFEKFSPAEFQAIIARYGAWREELVRDGKFAGGHKLRGHAGRVMRRNGSGKVVVTDGPFTEGKEVIGGLFVIEAASYDDAVAIAHGCPHLDFGSIEVREVEVTRRP